jgi:hypothetical protein
MLFKELNLRNFSKNNICFEKNVVCFVSLFVEFLRRSKSCSLFAHKQQFSLSRTLKVSCMHAKENIPPCAIIFEPVASMHFLNGRYPFDQNQVTLLSILYSIYSLCNFTILKHIESFLFSCKNHCSRYPFITK